MLKQKYIDLMLDKATLMGAVAEAAGKDVSTIRRWISVSRIKLTMLPILEAISTYTGDPISELTEKA